MSQRRRAAALAVFLTAVPTACSPARERTTPPIRVARPRISATHLTLPSAETSGLARFRRWPKACDLLTSDDVRAVLPQVTKIVETPQALQIRVVNLEMDGDFDVPDSSCEIRFWVAGTERKKRAVPDVLRVEDVAVGDVGTVKDNYDSIAHARTPVRDDLGAAECVVDNDAYYCRMPNIAFTVEAAPSVYIDRFAGQPARTETRTYWVRQVLPVFVRSIASKLPRG